MKLNKITGLMITGLLFAGAAQASVSSEDMPASLSVTGKLSSVNQGCRVTLSQESVSFTVDTSQLVSQGDNATAPQAPFLSMVLIKTGPAPMPFQTVISR
ncbi:hypothetical protein [Cronobacter sakazakii]|uniref:hypothetical protein n=1 Tax=Cronobacter sakazakii TaxID=28141 RepID=UPI002115EE84|nr:hypothetical protein [Cronobacter sakazakii]